MAKAMLRFYSLIRQKIELNLFNHSENHLVLVVNLYPEIDFMQCLAKAILKMLGWILLIPVYIYKYLISPFTPASCRHVPSCSEYAVQAIKIHGPFKGFWMATQRISKCHPWGTHGYDPVPPKNGEASDIDCKIK